jgi:hypothetical protein
VDPVPDPLLLRKSGSFSRVIAVFLFDLRFYPEDISDMLIRNISDLSSYTTTPQKIILMFLGVTTFRFKKLKRVNCTAATGSVQPF